MKLVVNVYRVSILKFAACETETQIEKRPVEVLSLRQLMLESGDSLNGWLYDWVTLLRVDGSRISAQLASTFASSGLVNLGA